MKNTTLIVRVFLWITVAVPLSCGTNPKSFLRGGEMGNPGDYLRFRFKWAQQRLVRTLNELRPDLLPNSTPPDVANFLITKKALLQEDVALSQHEWKSLPHEICAKTSNELRASIILSYEGCTQEATTIDSAFNLLISMTLQHVGRNNETFDINVKQAIHGVWQNMGGEDEHWENIATFSGGLKIQMWTDEIFWTGSHVILPIWDGHKTFTAFNVAEKRFEALPRFPELRYSSAVQLGGNKKNKLAVLLGQSADNKFLPGGWVLDLREEKWRPISQTNAPSPRALSKSIVLKDGRIFIWGGFDGKYLLDGGIYDPDLDSWQIVSSFPSIIESNDAVLVAAGEDIVVQVGNRGETPSHGAIYDLNFKTWKSLNQINAPQGRMRRGIWTGSYAVIWGDNCLNDDWDHHVRSCGMFDLAANSWRSIPTETLREVQDGDSVKLSWTGNSLIYWTQRSTTQDPEPNGAIFYPETNKWEAITNEGAPRSPRNASIWIEDGLLTFSEDGFNDSYRIYIDLYHPQSL